MHRGRARGDAILDLSAGWQVALDVVGWVGSGIVVRSMMQQRILRLLVCKLVGCLVQVLYNGVLVLWPVVVLAVVQVTKFTQLLRGRNDPATYSVAGVPARGPLLAHLVERHRGDATRFHPGFTTATGVFVVARGPLRPRPLGLSRRDE